MFKLLHSLFSNKTTMVKALIPALKSGDKPKVNHSFVVDSECNDVEVQDFKGKEVRLTRVLDLGDYFFVLFYHPAIGGGGGIYSKEWLK